MSVTGADIPQANRLTVLAADDQAEASATVERSEAVQGRAKPRESTFRSAPPRWKSLHRAGLAARIGKAAARNAKILPIILECKARGLSLRAIAGELMHREISTARGKTVWSAMQVQRVLLCQAQRGNAGPKLL